MKKIISVLLALITVASAISMTACNESTSETEAPTDIPTEEPTEEVTESETEDTEEDTVKNFMIIGDSYSTFEGTMPEGNIPFYYKNGRPETNVTKVDETWWYQVMEATGMNLVQNNSWSGSCIGYIGYNGADTSQTHSFIFRLRNLIKEGFFEKNKIDTVFVFGGTNDSWSNAPLGEIKYENFTEEDFYTVRPAIFYFMDLLRETLPEAEIYCLINTGIKEEVSSCLSEAAARNGMIEITFDKIEKMTDHPTINGMKQISSRVLDVMGEE